MPLRSPKDGNRRQAQPTGAPANYAWKERIYPVPSASRKQFRWKASALRTIQRVHNPQRSGEPVTVVVPALYNVFPAESIALGWLNEIDALHTIRMRIMTSAKLTGWDVFTF